MTVPHNFIVYLIQLQVYLKELNSITYLQIPSEFLQIAMDSIEQNPQNKSVSVALNSYHSQASTEKTQKRQIGQIRRIKRRMKTNEEKTQDLQNSKQLLINHDVKKKVLTISDYVDLPKISLKQPTRLTEEMIKNNERVQHKPSDPFLGKDTVQNKQQSIFHNYNQTQSEHNSQWAGWDITKLKVIPNSIDLTQNQLINIPGFNHTKQVAQKQSVGEKVKEKEKFRQRERRQRQRNLEMVSKFLSGKATFIWLFILGKQVKQTDLQEIKKIYSEYIQNDYEVPVCRSYEDALKFLNMENCFFKIIADLQSSYQLLDETDNNKKIIAIYLYNPQKQHGITRAFQMKKSSRKIKGMFMNLKDAAKQVAEDIQNEVKFIKVGDDLERERNKLTFPSFFILNGADCSEVTAYRLCLYGSLKLKSQKQRFIYLKQFTDMVEMRYANSPKELHNLSDYKHINHTSQNNENKFRQILQFYVRQTFYYGLTNSLLRMSRSAQEFRPCTIPFNETYHSIKNYYSIFKKQTDRQSTNIVTYRGAKLRNSDVKSLKIGSFIELLGFTSTSLKKSEAQKFMDNDSYLIQIHVKTRSKNLHEDLYDHGFVEINRYGLADQAYKNEEQVLFNALNVFKVIGLNLQSAVRKISLQYGALINILQTKPSKINLHEKAVISNYNYCVTTFNEIDDDGEVFLMAQQHQKCLEYYQTKIEEGERNGKNYGKLANVQIQMGDLDGAYQNAIKSLQLLGRQFTSKQSLPKNSSNIIRKNANIFEIKEDLIKYQQSIDLCLKINHDNWFMKVQLLKEKAQKKLQIGDFAGTRISLSLTNDIFQQTETYFEKKKTQINRQYFVSSLCCLCMGKTFHELEQQKELKLLRISQQQLQFDYKSDEINQMHLQIENIKKQFYEKTGDKKKLEESTKAAYEYSKKIPKDCNFSAIINAKYHVLQASIIDQTSKFNQYEDTMEKAIQLIKTEDPHHENIGIYSQLLATKRHQVIHNKLTFPEYQQINRRQQETNNNFDFNQHKRLYQQSKLGYRQATNNMIYNKGTSHPKVLQVENKMAQLDYDFSLLKHAEQTMVQKTKNKSAMMNSQGAKCMLLLAKIALSRGEVKRSFKQILEAEKVLRKALLKEDNIEYQRILINNPLYIDIRFHKVKVLNRQLKHHLALRELENIKKIVNKLIQNGQSKILLAAIYEEQADIMIYIGQRKDFQKYILKSIEIRQRQMGKFNIPNAICYSNLYKYLRNLDDYDEAIKYHYQAIEIFSRFPPDHPNAWVIHLSNSLNFYHNKQYQQAINEIQYCIKVAQKRYSSNHINLLKIELQYGKLLQMMNLSDKALNIFEELAKILEQNLKESQLLEKLQKQTDDEKLSIKKNLFLELKNIYSKSKFIDSMQSMQKIQMFENQIRNYQQIINTQQKLDSLKSIN